MSLKVYAPVSGKAVPVTEVPDPVFSDKGKGILQAAGSLSKIILLKAVLARSAV